MSVINQMLKQLEENRETRASIPPRVRPVVPVPARRSFSWIFLFALAVVVVAAGYYATIRLERAAVPEQIPPVTAVEKPVTTPPAPKPAVKPVEVVKPLEAAAPPAILPAPAHRKTARPLRHPVKAEPVETADGLYRKARSLIDRGEISEAESDLQDALKMQPDHLSARQALVGLFLQQKRYGDAEKMLAQGLEHNPRQVDFAITLARLQVEMGKNGAALSTLRGSEPYAEKNAEFQGFMAVLLQQAGNHREAIDYFRKALELDPGMANWWLALGISLEKTDRRDEALAAFRQARDQGGLSSELQDYVNRQIAFLERR
ncbi:MAG: tetratricopeptide repeat protein [Burkholderiales bacterium]|nr:tetratricopeptide repeat protein [Burkholderiales bacterium]